MALFPQGGGRLRAYLIYQGSEQDRFQGEKDVPRFIDESVKVGAPKECYDGAVPNGPLATFDVADRWVAHPYREGVVLVGDGAASNDPSYGEGLSLTVRDVRVLRDHLLGDEDWDSAGHAYAEEHDRYYGVIHDVTRWFTQFFLEQGAAAEARRARSRSSPRTRLAFPTTSSAGRIYPLMTRCDNGSLGKIECPSRCGSVSGLHRRESP